MVVVLNVAATLNTVGALVKSKLRETTYSQSSPSESSLDSTYGESGTYLSKDWPLGAQVKRACVRPPKSLGELVLFEQSSRTSASDFAGYVSSLRPVAASRVSGRPPPSMLRGGILRT